VIDDATRERARTRDRAFAVRPLPDLSSRPGEAEDLSALQGFNRDFEGQTAGRRETLRERLRASGFTVRDAESWDEALGATAPMTLTIAPLDEGFRLPDQSLAVIPEVALFGERVEQRRRRKTGERDPDAIIRDLTDLHPGAPVVHEHHGVGRYQGLRTISVDGVESEFLTLEYAAGDKLYVPVTSLHLIGRYTGADTDDAPLHRLGSGQWEKARRRAAEKARDVAAELLDIYAIHAVVEDLQQQRPMDRVVCGDVGFGKTEVAMRAAFASVQSGYQVGVLVPTTLLCQQHYQNFADRFADWPVRVEQLSRFQSAAEQAKTIEALRAGQVDIVIGTHKMRIADYRRRAPLRGASERIA
jgi:transcription-repair coupling factor (superfamily II helicase)